MRGMFALVVSMLAAVALLGVSNGAVADVSGKRIALLVGPTQDAFIRTWVKTFTQGAEKAGMKVSVFSSPFDPALQVQQIDDVIAQKFDMILLQTISQKAVLPALERVKNAKIPLVTIISQFPEGVATDPSSPISARTPSSLASSQRKRLEIC